jgi:hypothetical protein
MATAPDGHGADLHFYFDPICPFAWITSKWVRSVVRQRDYSTDWRFISLRILNRERDYATHFPPGYEHGHTAGLRLLRVAAAVRHQLGRPAVGDFYAAAGAAIFDVARPTKDEREADHLFRGTVDHARLILEAVGQPVDLATAVDDTSFDGVIAEETDEALSRTGRDVGTPIISFRPPDGPSFFGPVISAVPNDEDAVALWESVIHLATFPGFAELKRSLRERPRLRALGWDPADDDTAADDWRAGSVRS